MTTSNLIPGHELIRARLVNYCKSNALALGGMVEVLADGEALTFERACTVIAYCEAHALRLNGLLVELGQAVRDHLAALPAVNLSKATAAALVAAGSMVITYKDRPYVIARNPSWGGDFVVTMPCDGTSHTGSLAHIKDLIRTWAAAANDEKITANVWSRIGFDATPDAGAAEGAARICGALEQLAFLFTLCAPGTPETSEQNTPDLLTIHTQLKGGPLVMTEGPAQTVEEFRATRAHHRIEVARALVEQRQEMEATTAATLQACQVPTFQAVECPALDIDARIGRTLDAADRTERRIVRNLIAWAEFNGWSLTHVWDGDEREPMTDALDALELVFNLDMSRLFFAKDGVKHSVLLVTGNGQDIVSDWTLSRDEGCPFNSMMDGFDTEDYTE